MKTVQVLKGAKLLEGEMELINRYTRRTLTEDEVYVFTVVLCDNDIDRDYERFTVESLEKLSKLFVGKTGVFDHNPKAENQAARIISCSTQALEGRKNSIGEDYFRLTARAYMPVTEKNKDLRISIDSGINREVSVGCAVEETRCSICGNDINSAACNHIKGETYSGKLCFGELLNPGDAYEWSFVAIPSQREAGVIKVFDGKEKHMEEILKSIENGDAVTLTKSDSNRLMKYIDGLKKQAADGLAYRSSLVSEMLKYSAIVQPEISRATMENVADSLSIGELKEFVRAYSKKSEDYLPQTPQLYRSKSNEADITNNEFKI